MRGWLQNGFMPTVIELTYLVAIISSNDAFLWVTNKSCFKIDGISGDFNTAKPACST
jgi:hypothetical protein